MKPKPQAGSTFQVLLRGPRVRAEPPPVLRERIREVFRVTEEQANHLLDWRGILRQGLQLSAAIDLATQLRRCGLDARVTPTTRMTGKTPPPDTEGDRLAAFLDSPSFQAAISPSSGTPVRSWRLLPAAILALLLLPAYLGITLLFSAAWGAYLAEIGRLVGPQGVVMPLLALLVVAAGGLVLLSWLLIPLWLGPQARPARLPLSPQGSPALFAMLDACGRVVGVPRPIQVELSLDPSLRVQSAGGLRGWLQGKARLSIGLPVLAIANVGELAGFIAAALALTAHPRRWRWHGLILAALNGLEEHQQRCERRARQFNQGLEQDARAGKRMLLEVLILGLQLSQALSRLTARLILWNLRGVSARLAADADRYAHAIVGSQAFANSLLRLQALRLSSEEVLALNRSAWRSRRLLRDLPLAIHDHFQKIEEAQWQAIEQEARECGSGTWREPGLPERLRLAEREPVPGRYANPQPARKLVPGFHGITVELTARRYAAEGRALEADQFVESSAILPGERPRGPEQNVLHRFFNGQFRPSHLLDLQVPEASSCTRERWQEVIDQLRAQAPEAARTCALAAEVEQRRPRLLLVTTLSADPVRLGVADVSVLPPHEVLEQLENIRQRQLPVQRQLRNDQTLHALRIACAIDVMPEPRRREAEQLRHLLGALLACEREVSGLQEIVQAARLLQTLERRDDPHNLPHFRQLARSARAHALRLLQQGQQIPQHLMEGGTLHALLLRRCPDAPLHSANPLRFISRCSLLTETFHALYQSALARLAELCEMTEQEQGIVPICRLASPPSAPRQTAVQRPRPPGRRPLGALGGTLTMPQAGSALSMRESVSH